MNARPVTVAALLVLVAALTACGPVSGDGAGSTSSPPASASASETSSPDASASPSPSPTATTKTIALPTDCRAILSESVLAELGDTPLNDAAFGPSGVGSDGSLTCIWASPGADTTGLTTKISKMNRGPALDMLNALANDEGFSCFTPDGGTRCEKTWPNEQYPVTDGRTLFWRDGILIDTRYSNLAPTGYTSAIVARLFG
ncbi:hypothetical protein [Microbacterium oxydans]|uniref:DUF3558 domain-containing protein n=1 Tax=Microbacterium oxydans TaxID=82380 RepID=A0A0F0L7T6_9MICO|nr:hypothetical protein [Microbacterium oxydans]KJL29232.1 hypothetical protein RS83_01858 [Microbacterium oxydans]